MFVRKRPNKSGSVSVQVIDKSNGYRVVETIGSARDPEEVSRLVALGERFISRQNKQYALFPKSQRDNAAVLDFVQTLANASIRTLGPELIFGRLFDEIGFDVIPEPLFRDIVVARLVYPTSKLKTIDYLYRIRAKPSRPTVSTCSSTASTNSTVSRRKPSPFGTPAESSSESASFSTT